MRIAYLDCVGGISGDMLLGALLACGLSIDELRADVATLGIGGWTISSEIVDRAGICATRAIVGCAPEEIHGRHLSDVLAIIAGGQLPGRAGAMAADVFRRLAVAEAAVHGTTPEQIHFHEVGAVDALVDIVGSSCGLQRLGIDAVCCGPLPMGAGSVECGHGRIPLPAPAVLELCRGVPVKAVESTTELVTPTGAALAVTLAERFGSLPSMVVDRIGYGAGGRDTPLRPNVLRVVIGTSDDLQPGHSIVELNANLDDMNPQDYADLSRRLFAGGAVDVVLVPIQMKKGRPGTMLSVLSPPELADAVVDLIFRHTTTLGVRRADLLRYCADRRTHRVETPFGAIRVKLGSWRGLETVVSPEYDDLAAAAQAHDASIEQVRRAAIAAWQAAAR